MTKVRAVFKSGEREIHIGVIIQDGDPGHRLNATSLDKLSVCTVKFNAFFCMCQIFRNTKKTSMSFCLF
jgi:hypothetical protein